METAARAAGVTVDPVAVRRVGELEPALRRAMRERAQALLMLASPLAAGGRAHIARLSAAQRVPTLSVYTGFPDVGGWLGYGPDYADMASRAGSCSARIA